MAKQPTQKTINDLTFEFYPLSPKVALKVLTRITKLVGEPLGLVGDALSAGSNDVGTEDADSPGLLHSLLEKKLAPDSFAKAARALVNRLDEDEVINTIELVMQNVWGQFPGDRGTRRLNFEVDFAGETILLLKVFMAALEVNFGDFFAEKLGGVVKLSRA